MIAMLAKMGARASWLRPGVLILASMIALPLTVPAAASARIVPSTYVNQANALSRKDFKTNFEVAFQLRQSYYTPVLKAVNRAVALTSKCDGCNAIAASFQIVLVSLQDLTAIHALNVASATNYECVNTCDALALAYQIVVASDSPALTRAQITALDRLSREFRSLPKSGLTIDQVESQSEQMVNTAVSILEGSPSPAPASTPPVPASTPPVPAATTLTAALNGPVQPSELVNANQPVIDVYRDIQGGPSSAP
jgi:hypothetical protein